MASVWVIIEDQIANIKHLVSAIRQTTTKEDTLRVLWARQKIDLEGEIFNYFQQNPLKLEEVVECQEIKNITNALKLENDIIKDNDVNVLLDIGLRDVCDDALVALSESLKAILESNNNQNVICVYSAEKDYAGPTIKENFKGNKNIFASTINLQGSSQESAKEIVQQLLQHRKNMSITVLEQLWRVSEKNNWFGETENIQHKYPKGKQSYYTELENGIGEEMVSILREQDKHEQFFAHIHEWLKAMCGNQYQAGEYNLTLGSVFFIAMLAYYDTNKKLEPFIKVLDTSNEILNPLRYWSFLGAQESKFAKNTALALFNVFQKAFEKDEKHCKNESCLKNIVIKGKKGVISWEFSGEWDGHNIYDKLKTVAKFEKEKEYHRVIYPFEASNTTAALRLLHYYLQFAKTGFSHPGNMWIEEQSLFVGSLKKKNEKLTKEQEDNFKNILNNQ